MNKAIGLAEFKTVASGVFAADAMVKAAAIDIVEAQTVCPGKYLLIISGDLSAVTAAMAVAKAHHSLHLISDFILGNPHKDIFPAIYGATAIGQVEALGILETYDAVSAVVAADEAAKTALVELIELRLARGMCGKSYLMLTGDIAAVKAAIEKAKAKAGENGMYLDSTVIPRPDEKICRSIL